MDRVPAGVYRSCARRALLIFQARVNTTARYRNPAQVGK